MRIERTGKCTLRYIRNDGSLMSEVLSPSDEVDRLVREFNEIQREATTPPSGNLVHNNNPNGPPMFLTNGPPMLLPNGPSMSLGDSEPLLLPVLNFDGPEAVTYRQLPTAPYQPPTPTFHNQGEAPLALPAMTFNDSPVHGRGDVVQGAGVTTHQKHKNSGSVTAVSDDNAPLALPHW